MSSLFIIGNGFDMAQGISTAFGDIIQTMYITRNGDD